MKGIIPAATANLSTFLTEVRIKLLHCFGLLAK